MYILDTDHLTALGRGSNAAHELSERLDNIDPLELATTIVSYEEQTRGWLSYSAQARTLEKQIAAHQLLKNNLDDFCGVIVLEFNEEAAAIVQRLKQARIRIGTMDLRIAAIALSNDATLLTRNLSDFSQVPDLCAENWID